MNRRKTTFIVSVALLLAVVVVVAIWLVPVHRTVRSFVLPDGTKVTFFQVTYGTNHEAFYATDWRDHFARFVPARYATNWGFKRQVVVASAAGLFSSNNLVVWLKRSGPLPSPAARGVASPSSGIRATVVDANGIEARTHMISWNSNLIAFLLPNYPRRSRFLHLRIWDSSAPGMSVADQPLLAELEFPNPAPSTAPPLLAETLPAKRMTDGLEISLLKVETGYSDADFGNGKPASGTRGVGSTNASRTYSLAQVSFRQHGQPAFEWNVEGFEAATPTGTSFATRGAMPLTSAGREDHYFTDVLWPEEPEWDLTIKARRSANFPPEDTWYLNRIPLTDSNSGSGKTGVIETDISGVHLTFLGVGTSLRMTPASRLPLNTWTLNLTVSNYTEDVQLELVSLVNDAGQHVRRSGFSMSDSAFRGGPSPVMICEYVFQTNPGDTNVNATFAISRIVRTTFRVKPTVVP